uniref:Uncharacterized protein n=1 Tax=Podoviridae sp. ct1ev3 TaxID=2825216 RepID=A0A8S5TT54_9CAUD|nr:MAG TPA: hypothetical protein [Podoviridae sp. ct1ev3]
MSIWLTIQLFSYMLLDYVQFNGVSELFYGVRPRWTF